jgi:condensin complex subunit 3
MTKFSLSILENAVPAVFDQVQISSANHKKNAVALYKLQRHAATVTSSAKHAVKLTGEKAFGDLFIDMINRILVIKKGVVAADRVAKFVSTFVKYMTENGLQRFVLISSVIDCLFFIMGN